MISHFRLHLTGVSFFENKIKTMANSSSISNSSLGHHRHRHLNWFTMCVCALEIITIVQINNESPSIQFASFYNCLANCAERDGESESVADNLSDEWTDRWMDRARVLAQKKAYKAAAFNNVYLKMRYNCVFAYIFMFCVHNLYEVSIDVSHTHIAKQACRNSATKRKNDGERESEWVRTNLIAESQLGVS